MIKKKITQNLILISISLILMVLFLEIFIRSIVDNGMNYDIEMMKYSKTLKIKSKNLKVGIEHEKNKEAVLMGHKIILNEYGFKVIDFSPWEMEHGGDRSYNASVSFVKK